MSCVDNISDQSGSSWTASSFVHSKCPFIKRNHRKSVRFDESVTNYLDTYQDPHDANFNNTNSFDKKIRKCCKNNKNKKRIKRKHLRREKNKKRHFFCRHVWQGITR